MSRYRVKQEKLREDVYGPSTKVDREAGVIRGVKILGKESKNGRTYSDRAMSDAAKLYEGRKVNIDHMPKNATERPFRDVFGELRNIRQEADGIYGDLHFLKSHAMAEQVCEAAERFPGQFGLSHDADGKVTRHAGRLIVESVIAVHSVDLVNTPATNAGLFESVAPTGKAKAVKLKLRELVESLDHKVYSARLKEMDPSVGDMQAEMPEESGDMGAEDQISAAFKAMVNAVLDDTSMDVAGKVAKIKQILQTQEKLLTGNEPAKPADAPTPESNATDKAMESITKLTARLEAFELREACRLMLADANVENTADRMKLLTEAADESARKKLVESWPKITVAAVKKPSVTLKESAPISETRLSESLKSPDAFLRALRN